MEEIDNSYFDIEIGTIIRKNDKQISKLVEIVDKLTSRITVLEEKINKFSDDILTQLYASNAAQHRIVNALIRKQIPFTFKSET